MSVANGELRAVVEDVFSAASDLVLTQVADVDWQLHDGWLTGAVEIHGRSSSELAITCPRPLAAAMASAFFGQGISEDHEADMISALLEVANIMAGHVNGLMAAPSQITVPRIVSAELESVKLLKMPELAVAYLCNGEPLMVTLRNMGGAEGGDK